ncbi:hypothetical protein HDU85_006345 [Gaertneriomyces sp. JEL0708]|nr:hypothetical protein HDU85_006345 [Gaertneriomyces sp. JEL0708]
MVDAKLKEKLAGFLPNREERPTIASVLLPEVQRELNSDPSLARNLRGLFILTVLQKGVRKDEWYLFFRGLNTKPIISQTRPPVPSSKEPPFPVILIEIEDADILKFITGGLTAVSAIANQRVRVMGDLLLAKQLEETFLRSGGPEKAVKYLEKSESRKKSASKATLSTRRERASL